MNREQHEQVKSDSRKAKAFDWLMGLAEKPSDPTEQRIGMTPNECAKILMHEIIRFDKLERFVAVFLRCFASNRTKQMEAIYINDLRPLLSNEAKFTLGSTLSLQERRRQISEEGFSFKHDVQHPKGTLLRAAHCYMIYAMCQAEGETFDEESFNSLWPFGLEWWNPSKDFVENLQKSAALTMAEMDRSFNEGRF